MKTIDLNKIDNKYHIIPLKNNKEAKLYQVISTRVPEINTKEDILVYKYMVPCPLCDHGNQAYSYDGKYFGNIQLNCRYCGIYYRPVIRY